MRNFGLLGFKRAVLSAMFASAFAGTPAFAAPGDRMWVRDVRIERGEEVLVEKEMIEGANHRWYETGNWRYVEAPIECGVMC